MMRRAALFAATALGVILGQAATEALAADVRLLYTAGRWQVQNGVGDDQRPFCKIVSGGASGRRFIVEAFAGDPALTLQIVKDGWEIPPQTPVDVVIDIDGNRWPIHTTGAGQLIGISVPAENQAQFEQSFRAGRTMSIAFPGGTERPWVGSLTSSNAVYNAFNTCRGTMLGQGSQPSAGTQPFAAPATPAATQPFAQTPSAPAAAPPPPADATQPATPLPPIPPAPAR